MTYVVFERINSQDKEYPRLLSFRGGRNDKSLHVKSIIELIVKLKYKRKKKKD